MTHIADNILLPKLTDREHAVLAALARGRQSKEIGPQVGLSPKSVDKLIERLREKFDAPTRRVLALRYEQILKSGVIFPPQSFPLPKGDEHTPRAQGVSADSVFSFGDAATFTPLPPWKSRQPPSAPKLWITPGNGSRLVEMLVGTAALGAAILLVGGAMLGASVLR